MADLKTEALSKENIELFEHAKKRINRLKESRKNHYGIDLDKLWADADRDYIPHRLGTKTKRVTVDDEERGWRGALVQLGSNNWQSDVSQSNPFIKIQIALAILVDQNPSGVFTPISKTYQATTKLIEQLYKRSWEYARSKGQLKLFVYNLAKYGWAVGRTYPLYLSRKSRILTKYDQENPDRSEYEEKDVVEYNDIMRENLDPRNTWIDDMSKPNNQFSVNDWCWRKVYTMEAAKKEFGRYKLWDQVKAGGTTSETLESRAKNSKETEAENLVEAYFYESLDKDLFYAEFNGVPVVIEPLPISDAKGVKRLSLWQTYWNLRHAESAYGVGIYEAIRHDQSLLDRIRNMTIDQLTLSIYKMWFYQGTQALTDTGDIRITPGVGKQVLDPKNINWLDVPGPGAQAWEGLAMFRKDVDEASAITEPLLGTITGRTAFEIAQAKESALKRLKDPLDNILEALNTEGYITIDLIQLLYSIPETHEITDPELIDAYLKETGGDEELYSRDEGGTFTAKLYPEFPLNLETDEKGNLIETSETKFFRIKPRFLSWSGMIHVKAQSILTPSKQIDKALDLEMYNILIPLYSMPYELVGKTAESIVKLYDKDPKDILPDVWLQAKAGGGTGMPMGQPAGQPEQELFMQQGATQGTAPQAETVVPSTDINANPQGFVQKIAQRLTSPFRGGGTK